VAGKSKKESVATEARLVIYIYIYIYDIGGKISSSVARIGAVVACISVNGW